jgi:nitroreductase
LISLLSQRRSIRKYKSQPVEKRKIQYLVKAGLLSPSSRGINPWEFLVIDDKDIIDKLSMAKEHGSQFLTSAPTAIVIIGDTSKSDVCIEDCSIASTIIQLEAERLGLGSCWIQIRNRNRKDGTSSEKYVKELLSISDNYMIESIIAVGYKDEIKEMRNIDNLQYEKVHYNLFNK